MGDRLEEMVAAQMQFQARLGHKFAAMDVEERIEHIKTMALAAVCEITEALAEVTWKPWAHGTPTINAKGVTSELNDTWQFIANVWFAAMPTATPAEIADAMHTALEAKLKINHQRADEGYDGQDKCPACRRAYDDTYVTCVRKARAQVEGQNDVPAFCDQLVGYVSDTGEPLGFGSTGWYVVTP